MDRSASMTEEGGGNSYPSGMTEQGGGNSYPSFPATTGNPGRHECPVKPSMTRLFAQCAMLDGSIFINTIVRL
jgi:hypothetical protein